jgi:hypothetical protein
VRDGTALTPADCLSLAAARPDRTRRTAGARLPHGRSEPASLALPTFRTTPTGDTGDQHAAHNETPGVLDVSLISRSRTGSPQVRWLTGSAIRTQPGEAERFATFPDTAESIRTPASEVPFLEPSLKTDRPRRLERTRDS